MQVVFAESGISFPPWRQSACITSKWLPSNAEDVSVCAPDSSNSSTIKADSASSDPTGTVEESPFAGPVSAPCLTCQIPRTTSLGSVDACSPLVYTPRAKPPYYSDNSSGNILLSGSLAGGVEGILGMSPLADAFDFEVLADSSCIVYAGKTPDSWQIGKSGYFGTATSWKGSVAPIEVRHSKRLAVRRSAWLEVSSAVAHVQAAFTGLAYSHVYICRVSWLCWVGGFQIPSSLGTVAVVVAAVVLMYSLIGVLLFMWA